MLLYHFVSPTVLHAAQNPPLVLLTHAVLAGAVVILRDQILKKRHSLKIGDRVQDPSWVHHHHALPRGLDGTFGSDHEIGVSQTVGQCPAASQDQRADLATRREAFFVDENARERRRRCYAIA